ncbi:MAG: MBL fold metallo-hydrolase [archaeon]
MEVSVLASGSSGNCFYVGGSKVGVLVDAGISCKQICERLSRLGKDIGSIKGVFLTHEHIDHIRGVDVLSRNFGIPIFATRDTIRDRFICGDESLLKVIKKNSVFDFHGLRIEAFSKSHKAADPVSFSIQESKKRVSVITDLGEVNDRVNEEISKSDFLCWESNHDLQMLEDGDYPTFLKKWIAGDDGHLSNLAAANCVLEHGSSKLKGVVLSHLSENNNTPLQALTTWAGVFSQVSKERRKIGAGHKGIGGVKIGKKMRGFGRGVCNPEIFVSTKEKATELFKV